MANLSVICLLLCSASWKWRFVRRCPLTLGRGCETAKTGRCYLGWKAQLKLDTSGVVSMLRTHDFDMLRSLWLINLHNTVSVYLQI